MELKGNPPVTEGVVAVAESITWSWKNIVAGEVKEVAKIVNESITWSWKKFTGDLGYYGVGRNPLHGVESYATATQPKVY